MKRIVSIIVLTFLVGCSASTEEEITTYPLDCLCGTVTKIVPMTENRIEMTVKMDCEKQPRVMVTDPIYKIGQRLCKQ